MKLETLSIDHIYAWMQHFQLKETGKFIGNCNSQTCNRPMFCGQKHCENVENKIYAVVVDIMIDLQQLCKISNFLDKE
jgi:hypothetical protein